MSYSGADSEEPDVLVIVTRNRQGPCGLVARSTDIVFVFPRSDGRKELYPAANRMASVMSRLCCSKPGLPGQRTKGIWLQSHVEKIIPRQKVEFL